jgi:hypothetical protein
MADYYSPTVVQQVIPLSDMTPLELWLLSLIFDAVPTGDGLYFSASEGPRDIISIDLADLREAIKASAAFTGTATRIATEALNKHDSNASYVEIDASMGWWEQVFQDIITRSHTVDHISVITAFTCSRMRLDGFGGLVILITKASVRSKSLDEVLMDFLTEAEERGEIKPLE